ncbi:MAG: XRE family transcriptional regulator [Alphaproteobacteria bacterium]|nr:MAG: XRE family transcriptional regulator [Alphaproteobacteria bacterium]
MTENDMAQKSQRSHQISLPQGEVEKAPASTDPVVATGLIAVKDPAYEKPVFRRDASSGIKPFEEIDRDLGNALKETRKVTGLSREAIAELVGLSTPVYGRYERGFSSLTVTRLIHLCEVLNIGPEEMIFSVAPHLYGVSQEEAEERYATFSMVRKLDVDTLKLVRQLLEQVRPSSPASSSESELK